MVSTQVARAGAPALGLVLSTLAIHAAVLAAATRFGPWAASDALVASNSCIGGPSTAAAFASGIGRDDLVLPGVAWGTLGYAAGTALGLWLYDSGVLL